MEMEMDLEQLLGGWRNRSVRLATHGHPLPPAVLPVITYPKSIIPISALLTFNKLQTSSSLTFSFQLVYYSSSTILHRVNIYN